MKNHSALGRSALLCGVLLSWVESSFAQLIGGDDVVLTDPTPTIIFEDTDTPGSNWGIRGWQESFRIEQDVSKVPFLWFASATTSLALGYLSQASGVQSLSMGYDSVALGDYSLALGFNAWSTSASALAIGSLASATGEGGTALGYNASAEGADSIALGSSATATGTASTALGDRAYSFLPNTIVLGSIPGVSLASTYANVGMGTSAPSQAVDVERSGAAARFQLTSYTDTTSEAPQFIQRRARGSTNAPTAVQTNDNLGLFSFRGYNGSAMGGSRATITAQAAGNFTGASTPTRLIFATTPVGQTVPQQVLVITHDGKVQVNGQNLTVPDYVFEEDYELMPLEELRSFIDENGHLPGIPSANDVNAQGHDLAGSDMAHLRKIEELTLYTLQQHDRIQTLEERLMTQQERHASELADLRQQLMRLADRDDALSAAP